MDTKIGIVGAGSQGSKHAYKLKELNIQISGIVDIVREKAEKLAKNLSVPFFTSIKKLLKNSDGIIIATPPSSHYSIAKFFLSSGKSVLIEKPFTTHLWQARRLIEISRMGNIPLAVGMIERFHPGIVFLKKKISSPKFIEIHRMGPFPFRSTDVGVVMDLMIHDIDLMLNIIHGSIKKIQAFGTPVVSLNEDIANVRLIFSSGCVVNLTASRVSEEKMRKIRIFDKSSYFSLSFPENKIKIYKKIGNKLIKETKIFKESDPLKEEILDFLRIIRKEKSPLTSGEDALKSLSLAYKIEKMILKSISRT